MDDIKIRNFQASHPDINLPPIRQLQANECKSLLKSFAEALGLPSHSTGLEVLQTIEHRAKAISDLQPSNAMFRLSAVLASLGISAKRIYINWYRFNDIDEMSIDDLNAWFHDFWYPDSDDIELFDQSQKCILLIRHFDAVQVIHL